MDSSRNPLLIDPLSDFSLVSLFPRTFNQLVLDPHPSSQHSDPLEPFRAHLESLASKNANELSEQAQMVLDGVDNVSMQRDSENLKNAGDRDLGGNHENVLARRPALGRKRAQFSFKPKSIQSTESLNPFPDIDNLADPEEFFAAFEKHANVEKELRRQTGKPLMDLDKNVLLMAEKRRRPGLLGKSASYKHRFSIAPSGGAETFLSSQETLSQDLCSSTPSNPCLQTEQIGQVNAEKERPGGVNDEVPSSPDKDDESDEIIGMLRKRFKPVEINTLYPPELSSAIQSEFMMVGESSHHSQDKMSDLHDIVSTIAKESPLECNNLERRLGHPSTSPRPPKSPHSSISLLKARLFQSRKGKDPFSTVDVDLSPVGKDGSCEDTHHFTARDLQKFVKNSMKMQNISTVNSMIVESDYRSGDRDARETNPKSPMDEGIQNDFNIETQDFAVEEFTSSEKNKGDTIKSGIPSGSLLQMELDDDFVQHGKSDVNPSSPLHGKERDTIHNMQTTQDISKTLGAYSDVEMHTESEETILRNQSSKPAAHEPESNVVHDKSIHDFDPNNIAPAEKKMEDYSMGSSVALNMPHKTTCGVMEDDPSKDSDDPASKVSDAAFIPVDDHMESDNGVLGEDLERCNMEKSHCNMDRSTANAVEDHGEDRNLSGGKDNLDPDRPSSSLAQPLKKTQKATSSKTAELNISNTREPAKRRAVAARKHKRECKEFSQRKSLAGCGTQWEAGIRRSTRIRTRPLEFWNGERLLYGRIHNTLITVVGTKYFSRTNEAGQAALTVKSYVSDDYKHIVERASLH